ncbi:MAG: hypothetical protein SF028_02210 [Candidatus Sumerlaeia bacterium]|nr:hypothetical protein [Candidatus Sumerlaeia bacterium]
MKPSDRKLIARLVQLGALAPVNVEKVVQAHDSGKRRFLHDTIVSGGFASSRAVFRAMAEQDGYQFVDVLEVHPEDDALSLVEPAWAAKHRVLPISRGESELIVAMTIPVDVFVCDFLKARTRLPQRILIAEPGELQQAIRRHYHGTQDGNEAIAPEDRARARDENSSQSGLEEAQRLRAARMSAAETINGSQSDAATMMETGVHGAETVFEESDPTLLDEAERRRMASGAYLVRDADAPGADSVAKADELLAALIDGALGANAEALELTPQELAVRARARYGTEWRPAQAYPMRHHAEVVNRARKMAGALELPRGEAVERRFILPLARGQHQCVAHFLPTPHGEQVLLRFPENVPLLADPLGALALPAQAVARIDRFLGGNAAGLLFLTAPNERSLHRFYFSLLRRHVHPSREVVSLERAVERSLPGLTQLTVPTADLELAALANSGFMAPDLLGVLAVSNGTVLRAVIETAQRGITCVGAYTVRDSAAGLACLAAAGCDLATLRRGLMGYLHVEELALLCPVCAMPMPDHARGELPSWADREGGYSEATGCASCSETGRCGTVWAADLHLPDGSRIDEWVWVNEAPRTARLRELALAGRIDPRDFPG